MGYLGAWRLDSMELAFEGLMRNGALAIRRSILLGTEKLLWSHVVDAGGLRSFGNKVTGRREA